jgi:DnaJ family protein C protein 7
MQVDVDDNPVIAKDESLTFIPTFKIFKNGQKLKEIAGPSQQALECAVKHYSF